ncbi:MAG: mechanosensitive ion channel family protein [Nitrospirales bacterium]
MLHELSVIDNMSMQDLWPWLVKSSAGLLTSTLRIALVLLAGYIAVRFAKAGIRHLEAILIKAGEGTETVAGSTKKRVATLTGLMQTIVVAALWAIVGIIVMGQLGLDIAPILAGAGILGLAVGFGAQNLVRDVISGFFLVLENHVRIGDVAIINGTGGLVEAITYRVIVLRDLAGVVHVFPNGTINTLSNMTKQWSAYLMDIGIAYKEDTDKVVAVMEDVAEELQRDPTFGPKILGPLEMFGVDAFGDSAVTIKARFRTLPIEQWTVGREYRRRLKKAFDAKGIEIPFPHLSLYMGEATQPLKIHVEGAINQPQPAAAR